MRFQPIISNLHFYQFYSFFFHNLERRMNNPNNNDDDEKSESSGSEIGSDEDDYDKVEQIRIMVI